MLVKRHREAIYGIAYKISLHEEDALDITQNVYARLVEKIGSYRGEGTFGAWVAAITAREAISHIRRTPACERATDPQRLTVISDTRTRVTAGNPRDAARQTEDRSRVEAAMAQLSPQQRAILALHLREEMGPSAVARELDLPPKQVRAQLHRAITKLRQLLAPSASAENEDNWCENAAEGG